MSNTFVFHWPTQTELLLQVYHRVRKLLKLTILLRYQKFSPITISSVK